MTLTGYAGVLLANTAAASLTGWRRGLFLPVALAAGVGHGAALHRCSSLAGRAVVGSQPAAAAHRPPDGAGRGRAAPTSRPVALPTAIGCLAGAALLALPDGMLGARWRRRALLTVLYAVAMAVGCRPRRRPPGGRRRARRRCAPLAGASSCCAPRTSGRRSPSLLAVQGAFTLGWAWRTGRTRHGRRPRRLGDGLAGRRRPARGSPAGCPPRPRDLAAVEWYSLPAAVGLLIAAGPRLRARPVVAGVGPGLLVAAVPSACLAVIDVRTARGRSGCWSPPRRCAGGGARTGCGHRCMVGAGTALSLGARASPSGRCPGRSATALVVGSAAARARDAAASAVRSPASAPASPTCADDPTLRVPLRSGTSWQAPERVGV